MKIFGMILIGLGFASIAGGGLTPTNFSELLANYRNAKLARREPSLDEKWAYANHVAHQAGALLVVCGALVLLASLFLNGNE